VLLLADFWAVARPLIDRFHSPRAAPVGARRNERPADEIDQHTHYIDQHAEYQYASQVLPAAEISVKDTHDMPGHLARRFQQIAVAVFLAEVEETGHDLTPVQYAALAAVSANPGIDQVTLAGVIAYDRTTITGVVDRLAQKGLVARLESSRDRRARELKITDAGRRTLGGVTPAVEAAQRIILRGLTERESKELVRLLQKVVAAGNELSRAPLREAALPLQQQSQGVRPMAAPSD
jgi:MarR family transcriptional regulator, temperature-dependent positive regulator of motility